MLIVFGFMSTSLLSISLILRHLSVVHRLSDITRTCPLTCNIQIFFQSKKFGSFNILLKRSIVGTRYNRGCSNEYLQSMFWIKKYEYMYNPINPSFAILKWGVRGHTFHGSFRDVYIRVGIIQIKSHLSRSGFFLDQTLSNDKLNYIVVSASAEFEIKEENKRYECYTCLHISKRTSDGGNGSHNV